jgi:hypothetical protein
MVMIPTGLEPKITVLMRANSNLPYWQLQDRKTWSWVLQDLEPRMTMLARTKNNLPDQLMNQSVVSWQLPSVVSHEHGSRGISTAGGHYQARTCKDTTDEKTMHIHLSPLCSMHSYLPTVISRHPCPYFMSLESKNICGMSEASTYVCLKW